MCVSSFFQRCYKIIPLHELQLWYEQTSVWSLWTSADRSSEIMLTTDRERWRPEICARTASGTTSGEPSSDALSFVCSSFYIYFRYCTYLNARVVSWSQFVLLNYEPWSSAVVFKEQGCCFELRCRRSLMAMVWCFSSVTPAYDIMIFMQIRAPSPRVTWTLVQNISASGCISFSVIRNVCWVNLSHCIMCSLRGIFILWMNKSWKWMTTEPLFVFSSKFIGA